MNKEKYIKAVRKANCALDLKRKIIGVRFLFSKEEFEQAETEKPSGKMPYCRMITNASAGKSVKVDFDNFGCFASARVLGIAEMDDWYVSGRYYGYCGLYQDFPTAREITDNISKCNHKVYGLEIRPLNEFNMAPHIVIIISNTFNIMRLVQGYTYKYGTHSTYKFIGNQAMCAECTAHPYSTNDINVSLLCAGARKSGINEDEIALGIPLTKFVVMVDGLCETITPVESNIRKKAIEENFIKNEISDVEIIYNKNYGDSLHKYDFEHFLHISKK